jgi:hypothetical protein
MNNAVLALGLEDFREWSHPVLYARLTGSYTATIFFAPPFNFLWSCSLKDTPLQARLWRALGSPRPWLASCRVWAMWISGWSASCLPSSGNARSSEPGVCGGLLIVPLHSRPNQPLGRNLRLPDHGATGSNGRSNPSQFSRTSRVHPQDVVRRQ